MTEMQTMKHDENSIPEILSFRGDGAITIHAAAEGDGAPALRKFEMTAYTGGAMELGGFYYPVVVDLAGLALGKKSRPILMGHDHSQVVGHTDSLKIEGTNLIASGIISGVGSAAKEVIGASDNGFPWQASIGAAVKRAIFVREGKTATANGQEFAGPVYIVRSSRLGEISFVALGADDNTSARLVAGNSGGKQEVYDMDFEEWVKAKGKTLADLTEEEVTELRASFDAESAEKNEPKKKSLKKVEAKKKDDDVDGEQIQSKLEAENARVQAIKKFAEKYPEVCAKAIREGMTVEAAEELVIQAMREEIPVATFISRKGVDMDNRKVVEASLSLAAGIATEDEVFKRHGEAIAEAAFKNRRRGFRWAAEQIASANGVDLPGDPGSREWIHAAFSTADLGGIVGAVANKALSKSFGAVNSVAAQIAAPVSHSNFHSHTVYSMAVSGDMQAVAPDGQIKHLEYGNESRTRQVGTYGSLLSVTRQDITNDELGALTESAQRLGRKAAVAREKALFTAINATGAGSSHFTSARGNYFEGAATLLQLSSLTTAVQMFREQTGPDGDPVMIEPRHLVVPPAIEETAKALMDRSASLIAVALGSTSAKSKEPNANIWAGQFQVHVSPYLGSTIGSSGSDTAWYLIADPNDVPAFEIAYLNGMQTPTVEYFGVDSDPNVLGVTWRVYWDFGVALAEYRAGVKSKGAA